jgi:hypothetical protein
MVKREQGGPALLQEMILVRQKNRKIVNTEMMYHNVSL